MKRIRKAKQTDTTKEMKKKNTKFKAWATSQGALVLHFKPDVPWLFTHGGLR